MKWKLSLPEHATLVYFFSKLTGLALFTVGKDGFYPPTRLGKLYNVAFAAIYFLIATSAVASILGRIDTFGLSELATIGASSQVAIGFPPTLLTLMTFLLMHEQILYIMNKLYDIGNKLKSLGIEEDHGKLFKNIFVTIVTRNVFVIAIYVTLCFIEPGWTMIFSIKSTIDAWLYLNVILIFTQMLLFIRQRFKLLNEKLYNIFGSADPRGSLHRLQMIVVSTNSRNDNQPGIGGLTDLQRIRKIEAIHLELCDLVYRTTNLFAVPVLSKTIEVSYDLIFSCYWIYHIVPKSNKLCSSAKIIPILINALCTLLRTIVTIAHVFTIACASVKTCEEGNAVKAVLFKVWYKFKPRNLHNEFTMFSLQLIQKPIVISIFGYFNLDYSYVYQILGFVMAYVIILIQFDTLQ